MNSPVTALTAERVSELFRSCLTEDGDGISVEGIVGKATFSPGALEIHALEIHALLAELPDPFMKSKGGGWTFLNACNDRHGHQWTGFHRTMEALFMLGLATGRVTLLMPRELWDALPGGMPYYMVNDDGGTR